jgi:phosphatidylglycerophosphate synthase
VAVVDPVVLRVLPFIVKRPGITPDGVSLASLGLAAAAGADFLLGHLVVGAVLFELHFFLDCIDGKLARVRGTQNPRGGFVDLACDLVGTTWCFAALGYNAFSGTHRSAAALLTAVFYVTYTWSTLYRSRSGALVVKVPREGGWLHRHGFGRTPYGVEVEALSLFLVPLSGREDWVRLALYFATAFYLAALGRNVRATYMSLPSDG